ncbi:hypothetical protein [Halorussus halophilus]|uniref:hypothetical protein n=1 Tax=Halorussus halophilus TaxID=2650975 RepID=UPI001300D7F3|nr:hypothetical protein [Halorussus halophilus]
MADRPSRQTRPAQNRRRQSWHGMGEATSSEKDSFGVFLDDIAYVFADVSLLALPTLWWALTSADLDWFGVKATTFVAWLTMVLGGALIRGGWVAPLWTEVRGWVSMTPWLILFRVVYYNATLALAAFGGASLTAWSPLLAVGFAFGVGALSVGAFPRLAESFYGVVAD